MIARRNLLKGMLALNGALMTLPALPVAKSGSWRNWSGHLVAQPAGRFAPRSENELIDIGIKYWYKSIEKLFISTNKNIVPLSGGLDSMV